MKKNQLVIGQGKNTFEILKESINLFNENNKLFRKDAKIFIKVNLPLPQGYPIIYTQDLLYYLIKILLEHQVSKIVIEGYSYFGISTEYIWNSIGFNSLIANEKINFIPFESFNSMIEEKSKINNSNDSLNSNNGNSYLDFINQFDSIISIINLNVDPIFGYTSSIWDFVYQFISSNNGSDSNSNNEKIENNETFKSSILYSDLINDPVYILNNYIEYIQLVKPQKFVIVDMRTFSNKLGSPYYLDSQVINLDTIVFSSDLVIIDYVIDKIVKNPKFSNYINPILNELQKKKSENKISNNMPLELFGINDNIEFKLIKSNLNESKSRFIIEDLKPDQISNSLIENNFFEIENLESMCIEKIYFQIGNLSVGLKRSIYDFIHLLKSSLIKDIENIDNLYIFVGVNPPPLPEDIINSKENSIQKIKIIVYGDEAITSTGDYNFRFLKKKINIKTEEELERERVLYQSNLREQLIEWESKMEETKTRISEHFKNNELKLKKGMDSLEKQHQKIIKKLDKKYRSFEKKQQDKYNKMLEKSKVIKYKLNKNVLEIPGKNPNPYDYIDMILKFIGKNWMPTMCFWNNILSLYFDRREILKQFNIFRKQRNKIFNSKLKILNNKFKN